jgi:hypothetical protein
VSVPIDAKTTEWCQETYVEVYEKDTNKLVSRVKESEIQFTDLSRVDISFISGEFTGYCDYCYDGIKNYDEERVDCGGPNCPSCIDEEPFFDWAFWVMVFLWGSLFMFTGTRVWMERENIVLYVKELGRQKSPFYSKGVEETMLGQKTPIKIKPKPIKVKEPKVKFVDLVKRFVSRQPHAGTKTTEVGISKTKPRLGGKSYSEKNIRSYKEQKQLEKQGTLMSKVKEFFKPKPKPAEKLQKITKKSVGSDTAAESISRTKKELGGKGF